MTNYFEELVQAMRDLYFQDGERMLFDGFYKIASWCEEGDWQYVLYYLTEDDEWETLESGYFCYFDGCTKEVTPYMELAEKWIIPVFMEELENRVMEEE